MLLEWVPVRSSQALGFGPWALGVPKSVKERYADLRPSTDDLMERAQGVLAGDLAAFNAVAARAGAPTVTIK